MNTDMGNKKKRRTRESDESWKEKKDGAIKVHGARPGGLKF